MKIFKKIFLFITIFSLVFNYTGVFAWFIWESSWLDFFKTLDKWYTASQTRLIENSLAWSAANINKYLKDHNVKTLDKEQDFTRSELDLIEKWSFWPITSRLNFDESKWVDTNQVQLILTNIQGWYKEKKNEISKEITNANRVSVLWIYNDWDVGNSWYDIVTDIEKIHSVIFNQAPKYSWPKNTSANDFATQLAWFWDTTYAPNLNWLFNNPNSTNWNTYWPNDNPNSSWAYSNSSNLCNSWTTLDWLDASFLNDLDRQINLWDNSNSVFWWKWWVIRNPFLSWNLNTWDKNSWLGWGWWWKWPCAWFICIKIEFKSYSQWLFWWWNNTIESIIDSNLKIIDKISNRFLWASDMTRWEYILSILRKLNFPNMLSLWVVVSHLPPPILNLDASKTDKANKYPKNPEIFDTVFKETWLNYNRPNYINKDYAKKDFSNTEWLNTNQASDKNSNTEDSKLPETANVDVMIAKIKSSNAQNTWDNVKELVWFSNTFQTNLDTIIWYTNKMVKTKGN